MKARKNYLSAASALALSATLALSGSAFVQLAAMSVAQAAVVRSIDVRGNTRVDSATIQNTMGISPGQNVSADDLDQAVKRLYGTGLFSDVQINQSGATLIVQVSEHQTVNQVLFQGNSKIKDAQLAQAVQTQPRSPFNQATMDADTQLIRDAYGKIGRDEATVSARIIDLGQNRVNVVFEINEGGRTKIASINFEGNSAYSDRRLSQVIATKRSNMLSFFFRDDIYDEDRIKADEEALRRFYFNRGYADFQVISATGTQNADNSYEVNFVVDEGKRYRFGAIAVESSIPEINPDELNSALETRQGDWYSAKEVEDTIIALTETVAGRGYAFAQVTPRGDRNLENDTISVVYSIDQGARAYVERIEIRGNDRTRDYVIRREFDIAEGDAFNQVLIQRAKRRLEALDYFERVEISTAPGSGPDQVILVVDLVEKSTGEFSIGAGYATGGESKGPSVEGSVTERNFLGRGQFIRISAAGGKNSRDFAFSFTEPYFLGSRVSAGFDVFRSTRRYDYYESEATGGTVRFGLPITESISTQLAYNYTQEKYKYRDYCFDSSTSDGFSTNPDCRLALSNAIDEAIDYGTWVKSSVSGSVVYNTIDDPKNPHAGIYAIGSVEYAGLGGDAEFVKMTARASYYQTLSEELDVVGVLTGGAGHVIATGDRLRVFDHFKSNTKMIRGFAHNGIGPYDSFNGQNPIDNHVGGTTYFNASAEAQFPLPLIPESLGLRGAVFADAATLYGSKLKSSALYPVAIGGTEMKWRASVGVGLSWNSPFGPLRIDYAVPVSKEKTDDVQEFNFGMSSSF